jgi:hypothetical protein
MAPNRSNQPGCICKGTPQTGVRDETRAKPTASIFANEKKKTKTVAGLFDQMHADLIRCNVGSLESTRLIAPRTRGVTVAQNGAKPNLELDA